MHGVPVLLLSDIDAGNGLYRNQIVYIRRDIAGHHNDTSPEMNSFCRPSLVISPRRLPAAFIMIITSWQHRPWSVVSTFQQYKTP